MYTPPPSLHLETHLGSLFSQPFTKPLQNYTPPEQIISPPKAHKKEKVPTLPSYFPLPTPQTAFLQFFPSTSPNHQFSTSSYIQRFQLTLPQISTTHTLLIQPHWLLPNGRYHQIPHQIRGACFPLSPMYSCGRCGDATFGTFGGRLDPSFGHPQEGA